MFVANNAVSDWLFPRRCLLCDDDIKQEAICVACESFCYLSSMKFNSHKYPAIFLFEMSIKELIKGAKFNKNIAYLYILENLLDKIDENFWEEIRQFSPEIITFVPNHWLHRILRSIEIPAFFASYISRKLKIPFLSTLKKNRFLNRQAVQDSKKARKQAIKGVFTLNQGLGSFSRILLVDDIVTTGATFNEANRVLGKKCGYIRSLALAKTP
jgi:competence protein ComFC